LFSRRKAGEFEMKKQNHSQDVCGKNYRSHERKSSESGSPSGELKTLQDLELPYTQGMTHIMTEELKVCVMKWAKEDLEAIKKTGLGMYTIIKRWMDRFNITEEDLK